MTALSKNMSTKLFLGKKQNKNYIRGVLGRPITMTYTLRPSNMYTPVLHMHKTHTYIYNKCTPFG